MNRYLLFFCLFLFGFTSSLAQKKSKIIIENADFSDINETELPGATLLTGNVRVNHDGVIITCNKAYYFNNENYIKAFGNVEMVQGDTLYLNSKYAEYDGNIKRAFATGDASLHSPDMSLVTDTINFDRIKQEAYYNSKGTIVNKETSLVSKSGRYIVAKKKYEFRKQVVVTNPKCVIKSNNLDYYPTTGNSYLRGPSTIKGKDNFIYTENGFYNTKKNLAHFKRKSYIRYNDRLIEGDSLYYDRNREFASGTNNVKITDSINKAVIRGHYGEIFKNKDSLFVTKHAVATTLVEKDSMYIHGKRIVITGPSGNRIVRAYNDVRFFKTDMSGKCDSIHSDQKIALTKLIGKPILWNYDNQMTGTVMHLIGNNKTEKLDSLKVLGNSFIVSKDTLGSGYNQVKGINLYGKFKDNKLYEVDVVKNTEVIYYMRNDNNELTGINKNVSSRINMTLDKNKIDTITFYDSPDGIIYPEKDLPENARKLRGFIWRGDERIRTKEDIFPEEEKELDAAIKAKSNEKFEKEQYEMAREEVLDENSRESSDIYSYIFKNYNNYVIIEKNGHHLLVKNGKFKFPTNEKSFENYKKKHPKYKEDIKINRIIWDYSTMVGGKYDGGLFTGNEVDEKVEYPAKDFLTYDEIFRLYNNRIIKDKNGIKLWVKEGKFRFQKDEKSYDVLIQNNPKLKTEVWINQKLWDWNTMVFGQYDGGLFDGTEPLVDIEYPSKVDYTYDEIFKLYNNRIIIEKNGHKLLVKDGKFRFPKDEKSFDLLLKNNPKLKNEVWINQKLWDFKTMIYGPYDGGLFTGEEKINQ